MRLIRFTLALIAALAASLEAHASGFVPPDNLAALQAQFRRPDTIPFSADNPYTPEAALLGRTLFFDARLSGSGSLACSTCHNPSFGWEDGLALGHGEGLRNLGRHTPSILNVAWSPLFFWDGRAASLEAQASGPLGNPREMDQDLGKLTAKLRAITGYAPLFERAYPGQGITLGTAVKALAVFERTVASGPSPFDAWVEGDESAIPDAAKRGFVYFAGGGRCAVCHTGSAFTDGKFHDIGLPDADRGRVMIAPGDSMAEHAFKTPTLRNVARRAPYMHDGSMRSLQAVLVHYINAGVARPSRAITPLNATDGQIGDLLAFLRSLSEPARSFPSPTLPQ